MATNRKYSDFDFENLVELYAKQPWLRHEANHEGLEDLWFDYSKDEEKTLIKKLIENFKYLSQEEAEIELKKYLIKLIPLWNLKPSNTFFIGFKKTKFADGSSIFLNFIKSVIHPIDVTWMEQNFYSYLYDGIDRIKKGGFEDVGIDLENVVIVDDFIGTGGTAINIHELITQAVEKQKKVINIYLFSLSAMESGCDLITRAGITFETCFSFKKGTELAFPVSKRSAARKAIRNLEGILHEGNESMKLQDHTLGYGESEAAYAWNRFNIPNNNYPIFWWHRYLEGSKRKTMFNRNQ